MIKSEYKNMYDSENGYWWYIALHRISEKFILKLKKKERPEIFDAGCGTGRMLEILNKNAIVEGIDFEPEAVEYSKQRNLNSVSVCDLNLWKHSKFYDFIICHDVICHKSILNDSLIIEEFFNSLNPGGYLIMNLPAFESIRREHDRAVFTARRYNRNKTKEMLIKIGFKFKRSTYRLPFLYFLFFIKSKLENKKSNNKIDESDLKPLPVLLNKIMILIMNIENFIISSGISFPLGSSLFIVAQKPEDK